MSGEKTPEVARYEKNKTGAIVGGTFGAAGGLVVATGAALVTAGAARGVGPKLIEAGRLLGMEAGMRVQENMRDKG